MQIDRLMTLVEEATRATKGPPRRFIEPARIVNSGLKPAPLLVLADIEKVFAQDGSILDDYLPLDRGGEQQEPLVLLFRAKAHHPVDSGHIVPRAVEEDDLARRREMRDVALDVDLRLLAVRGGG